MADQQTSAAVAAVFNTVELATRILEYLDELSLIRAQRVCTYFRAIIRGTRSITKRIGLLPGKEAVLNPERDDCRTVRWNPLLDWFTTRLFIGADQPSGPIQSLGDVVMLHLLPHAYQAGQKAMDDSATSLNEISATTPQISKLIIYREYIGRLTDGNSHLFTRVLRAKNGISIGQMLSVLAKSSPQKLKYPVVLQIQTWCEQSRRSTLRFRPFDQERSMWAAVRYDRELQEARAASSSSSTRRLSIRLD